MSISSSIGSKFLDSTVHNTLELSEKAAPKGKPTSEIPDWWKKLNESRRRKYLTEHPRSKYRGSEVKSVINSLDDKQKNKVVKTLRKMTGKNGTLTKAVNEKLDAKKIKPAEKAKIATLIKAAKGDKESADKLLKEEKRLKKVRKVKSRPKDEPPFSEGKEQNKRKEWGYRGVAISLATAGLLVVGSAALVAAGVPLEVFTPELVKFVWMDLPKEITGSDNDELVGNLVDAIKNKFEKGASDSELEAGLMKKNDS